MSLRSQVGTDVLLVSLTFWLTFPANCFFCFKLKPVFLLLVVTHSSLKYGGSKTGKMCPRACWAWSAWLSAEELNHNFLLNVKVRYIGQFILHQWKSSAWPGLWVKWCILQREELSWLHYRTIHWKKVQLVQFSAVLYSLECFRPVEDKEVIAKSSPG